MNQRLNFKTLADDQQNTLLDSIKRADSKFAQLDIIIQRVVKFCIRGGRFLVRLKAWFVEKPRIVALQEELHTIEASLNIMLGPTQS